MMASMIEEVECPYDADMLEKIQKADKEILERHIQELYTATQKLEKSEWIEETIEKSPYLLDAGKLREAVI